MPNELTSLSYDYSPGTTLDTGEWFKIEGFSDKKYAPEITKTNYASVDYNSLQKTEYQQIDYLFVLFEKGIYFQNIGKARLVKKKGILSFGEEYSYEDELSVLVVNEYPDAIYISDNDTLYFQRLESITSIFNGISELYREATKPEVDEFLRNDFIALANGFDSSKVKVANRKRIAMAMDTFKKLHEDEKEQIFSYIHDYCPELETTGKKFHVDSEESLKMVLFGIEQRFYTTPIGGEKRIANSVIPLKNKKNHRRNSNGQTENAL